MIIQLYLGSQIQFMYTTYICVYICIYTIYMCIYVSIIYMCVCIYIIHICIYILFGHLKGTVSKTHQKPSQKGESTT